jgi:leader peptidase (prepilin peptidase)/N-methyltransferase
VTALSVVVCSLVGLVVGWLADPLITRVPQRQPLAGPSDPLPADPVPASDADVPILIPARRAVVAVVCGALGGAVGARFDDSWALPAYLVLALGLVVLSVIDLEHFLLPNRIVYPLTLALLVLFALGAAGDDDWHAYTRALVAAAVTFVSFFVVHFGYPHGMGFGDVRLSFTLGLSLGYLGWGELAFGIFLGFLYGAVVGLLLIASRLRSRDQPIPFGPFLAAGALTAVLVGTNLVHWYTRR